MDPLGFLFIINWSSEPSYHGNNIYLNTLNIPKCEYMYLKLKIKNYPWNRQVIKRAVIFILFNYCTWVLRHYGY